MANTNKPQTGQTTAQQREAERAQKRAERMAALAAAQTALTGIGADTNALACTVGGQAIMAAPKQFGTGSLGYYASAKITLPSGHEAQVVAQVVILGTKPSN